MARIVDKVQRSHSPRLHRSVGILHFSELDPAALGKLLPQKFQPFS